MTTSDQRADRLDITFGPIYELHSGAHYSLSSDPPPFCRYHLQDASHVFVTSGEQTECFSPHRQQHLFEGIKFPAYRGIVHASRWPVLDHPAWVVDMDDLGYPVIAGRYAIAPSFAQAYQGNGDDVFRDAIHRRAGLMLSAYAHPSCKAILFHSEEAMQSAQGLVDWFVEGHTREACFSKFMVVYPASRAIPEVDFVSKWDEIQKRRIVFCGREFLTKRGDIALDALSRIKNEYEVEITYIGMIPDEMQQRHADLLGSIEHIPYCSREQVLEVFARSHVLMHPSEFEALGIVFLEAAASGLAVVSAQGDRMPNLSEVFADDGAIFVHRQTGWQADEDAEGFYSAVARLLQEPEHARILATNNYKRASTGKLSIRRRNELLMHIYAKAFHEAAGPALSMESLLESGQYARTLSIEELDLDLKDIRQEIVGKYGVSNSRLNFDNPYPVHADR